MTATTYDELTVVKLLLADHSVGFVATATKLDEDVVMQIADRYGYPDKERLGWAVDELTRQADNAERASIPAAATVRPVSKPKPAPAKPAYVEPEPTFEQLVREDRAADGAIEPPSDDEEERTPAAYASFGQLIELASYSERARTRAAGERISRELSSLRERLVEEETERLQREADAEKRQKALAELAAAEEALRKARENAKQFTRSPATRHTGTNRPTNPRIEHGPKVVRAWATANNIACPARGRIPTPVVQSWLRATTNGAA